MRARGVYTPTRDYRAARPRRPREYERLLDALTINVTRFYRNAETWNLLRADQSCPRSGLASGEIRVWSAGCSSGEEPYTLAALFAEHAERRPRHQLDRLQVDATDIDRGLDGAPGRPLRPEAPRRRRRPSLVPRFDPAGARAAVTERVRRLVAARRWTSARSRRPAATI